MACGRWPGRRRMSCATRCATSTSTRSKSCAAGCWRARIERRNYAAEVVELRKRYVLLSVPLERWTVD